MLLGDGNIMAWRLEGSTEQKLLSIWKGELANSVKISPRKITNSSRFLPISLGGGAGKIHLLAVGCAWCLCGRLELHLSDLFAPVASCHPVLARNSKLQSFRRLNCWSDERTERGREPGNFLCPAGCAGGPTGRVYPRKTSSKPSSLPSCQKIRRLVKAGSCQLLPPIKCL